MTLAAAMAAALVVSAPASARPPTAEEVRAAAIHPVATSQTLSAWLSRVPLTKDFPPDFTATLSGGSGLFMIEMSTAPGCLPCADFWGKLGQFRLRYGWTVRTLNGQDALLRSGRLGLPWVGHPVAWVRPVNDPGRIIPIAVGTDHRVNISRNAYLAAKMLTGVQASVGLRGMAKFTGIVGTSGNVP